MKSKWVITCEHGGNSIPQNYASFFSNAEAVLQSHRGYDPGAIELYHLLAPELSDFSHFSLTSRLLAELNRSLHHKNLFSLFTKPLPEYIKREILDNYYFPYRNQVEEKIRQFREEGFMVYHLSVHSFTPELNGDVRNADIGLLYDPAKEDEKSFCSNWKENLHAIFPEAKIRLNYPYLGKADGFPTYLRKQFPNGYAGIELEVNQKHTQNIKLKEGLLRSLRKLKKTF